MAGKDILWSCKVNDNINHLLRLTSKYLLQIGLVKESEKKPGEVSRWALTEYALFALISTHLSEVKKIFPEEFEEQDKKEEIDIPPEVKEKIEHQEKMIERFNTKNRELQSLVDKKSIELEKVKEKAKEVEIING